jgi:hypothetical protein
MYYGLFTITRFITNPIPTNKKMTKRIFQLDISLIVFTVEIAVGELSNSRSSLKGVEVLDGSNVNVTVGFTCIGVKVMVGVGVCGGRIPPGGI